MGGLIVQKYLESHEAPGRRVDDVHASAGKPRVRPALDTAPPVAFRQNGNHRKGVAVHQSSGARPREILLARIRRILTYSITRHGCKKKARGSVSTVLLLSLPRPKRVKTPLLVLGADEDGAHTRKEMLATARAYRTEAEFFPNMGHNMMLEPGWTAVAERIDSWLGTRGL